MRKMYYERVITPFYRGWGGILKYWTPFFEHFYWNSMGAARELSCIGAAPRLGALVRGTMCGILPCLGGADVGPSELQCPCERGPAVEPCMLPEVSP